MRVALFSPMPPSKSGIADYTEALAAPLGRLVDLEIFSDCSRTFDPARFDTALYQIGNNPAHEFVYETALRYPGVAVLHEANLHHLIAGLTIRRGDWDAYLAECEYDGGPAALDVARRVRALEIGPDYEGVPMTRRLLESSRAVVVHSGFVEEAVRCRGFAGPVARIPHGAWMPPSPDRYGWRSRLGVDDLSPLIGIFGFLKPYKRIAESLRAFRRLIRLVPRARLILVGERHPDFQAAELIETLGLAAHVRLLEFVPIEDFTGYLSACDIVLNLRWPTVGETSGTQLRAMGLGKPVLVSDVGAFAEYPADTCLKVPVGAGEEDLIFEYLDLLVSRPEVARALGARARRYVEQECSWERVAVRYADFLEAVVDGCAARPAEPEPEPPPPPPVVEVEAAYIAGWAADDAARDYIDIHLTRLAKTLAITPPGGPGKRVLEMGAYMQITPALQTRLGYGEVRGCYFGPAGRVDRRETVSVEGERFCCEIDHFDAEKDVFPYKNAHFSTVLCGELIEHLAFDPMHMMSEINRILEPGGHLVLTTPNIASARAVGAILEGHHPAFFASYIRPKNGELDPRHAREYTPGEIRELLENSGFVVTLLETGPFIERPRPERAWVLRLLDVYQLPADLRGDGIYAVGRKTGPVRERYPAWLYA